MEDTAVIEGPSENHMIPHVIRPGSLGSLLDQHDPTRSSQGAIAVKLED